MSRLSKAEQREIERHKYFLSEQAGHDVGYEHAFQDWMRNYSKRWREDRYARMLEMQREEILRHKWIESERARHDLGKDAILDWISRYAAQWRAWYEAEFGDSIA